MGSGRGWLARDWPSTGGVVNITAAAWTAGFHWWRSGNKKRTQNVSEYMFVLALCLAVINVRITRMLADAQRDGRPAEYRWRPLRKFRYSPGGPEKNSFCSVGIGPHLGEI